MRCFRTARRSDRATGRSSLRARRCRSTSCVSRDRGPGTPDHRVPRPRDGARQPFQHRALAFDRILDEVKSGSADAGLLIHEGQLTYADEGLVKVLDLGEWWLLETGLPLPLGVNVARRDVPRLRGALRPPARVDRDRPRASRRGDASTHSASRATSTTKTADRFIDMYVNELTCDYGDEGRQAVAELLRRAEDAGVYEQPVRARLRRTL